MKTRPILERYREKEDGRGEVMTTPVHRPFQRYKLENVPVCQPTNTEYKTRGGEGEGEGCPVYATGKTSLGDHFICCASNTESDLEFIEFLYHSTSPDNTVRGRHILGAISLTRL